MKKFVRFFVFAGVLFYGGNSMALSMQEQTIVKVSANAALGHQENLKSALIYGLEEGVSINEFKEILVQAYAYCGFPRSLNALSTLMNVVNERGNRDMIGVKAGPKPEGNALEYGTQNQTKLVGSEVKGGLFEFVPQIDEYLKAHLFGDIFSRDNVSWKTREIATVAMLAVRDGVDGQLNAHINIAKHNGVSDEDVAQILEIARAEKAKNVMFGFGEPNTAYAQYFVGNSYLKPLISEGVGIANVTFEPKCRNNWHIHHKGGQILLVVAGRGWYQEWGKEAQELKPGDVVNIAPEVKHWHGAAKDSWFTHIAIAVPAEGSSNEWLEPVSDEEYNKLK